MKNNSTTLNIGCSNPIRVIEGLQSSGFAQAFFVGGQRRSGNGALVLAAYQSTIFLYDLPKNAIKKVILGCDILRQSKEEIYNDIAVFNNKVEILEAERHPNRFELIFK